MLRVVPVFIGIGLTALWVVALTAEATVWYTWLVAIMAMLAFASVGLIPDRRSGPWAAFWLGLIGTALLILWGIGLATPVTAWLPWWTLIAGILTLTTAAAVAAQGRLDGARTRRTI